MSRLQLAAVEAAIIVVGLALVYALIGWPFGGSGDDVGAVASTTHATASSAPTRSAVPTTSGAPQVSASGSPEVKCGPAITPSFLSANTIVSYYGNPYAETLGILGEHSLADLPSLLHEQAGKIDVLNGLRGVQPAFHIVWGTAQPQPGADGKYVNHVDPQTTQEYLDIACQNHFLVFLDLQNGQSDPLDELEAITPYLMQDHVHVAMDPEFSMHDGEVPGQAIGHLDGAKINEVQAAMEKLIEDNNLPDKVLIVHQFDDGMIIDKEAITSFPHVRLVIDMDGFGPADGKTSKFYKFAVPAEHSGLKIFFKQDSPRLTDEEIAALDPDVLIYQ